MRMSSGSEAPVARRMTRRQWSCPMTPEARPTRAGSTVGPPTPVVSSRIGAEGLHLVPDRHLTVCTELAGMADGIIEAIRRPEEARDRAEEGRRLVARRYDWDKLAEAFVEQDPQHLH